MHCWSTPIYEAYPKSLRSKRFNRSLTSRAVEAFDGFAPEMRAAGREWRGVSAEHHDFTGPSLFFDWQCQSWDREDAEGKPFPSTPLHQALVGSQEFRTLHGVLSECVRDYPNCIGKSCALEGGDPELFTWASVHRDGGSHLQHVHPGSIVSGVYYSSVPDNAGCLLFDDPRDPLPPFNERITIHPARGKLVMFPSWLTHQVTPTTGQEPRVSWSFNVLNGGWDHTSAIMVPTDFADDDT